MSLGATEIAAVVGELEPLSGSAVEAVRLHAERALTLDLWSRAGRATILVSAEPDATRIHACAARPARPEAPFPFQALLRREIEGARFVSLAARAGDRVVELRFERAGTKRALVAELTGRHGNLFLLDEAGIVRGSAGRNLSRRRRLVPGEPWVPPAARGPEVPRPNRFRPIAGQRFPLSAAIEAHYGPIEAERALAEARRRLREPLRAAVARTRRGLDRVADEADRVAEAGADRSAADLIKANLGSIRRGAREARLTEWTAEGPRERAIALDPALSPQENMERLYRRYRRIAESAERVAARRAELEGRLGGLLALGAQLDGAGEADLGRIEREARRLGAGPRPPPSPRRGKEEPAAPYRAFRSLSGHPILVGRGAAENDALSLRVARGNDLWLHARGSSGAHVVVRLPKGQGPDQETLLDAAHLAAHFSGSRQETAPEVIYTRAKYVRKPRGAAPGAVICSQERALLLRLEPARLERLLGSEEEGP
jgi:predicted ribosome quality control (RQC) complex YloA/Tae2 family protein